MTGRRAQTLAEYEAQTGFMTDESYSLGVAYQPARSDVFISPYAKCGTTWMQQIVHGLRTGGSMDFAEITEVVPWLELAHDTGMSVDDPQVAHPRAFKSHLPWDEIPKGGRYIVVLRDPVDAMVSLYNFLDGWFIERGAVSLEQFVDHYLSRGEEGYWHHAASWWRQRHRDDILLFCFEDIKADLPGTVHKVADFIGIGPENRDVAIQQAGFEFMKAHADKFDDNLVHRTRDAACGLPLDGESTKVAKGKTKVQVSNTIRARLDAHWAKTLGTEFGLTDYADMRRQHAAL